MGKIFMAELADMLAQKAGISKREAQQFLTDFVETIQDGVNNDKLVKIKGLGTFKVIDVDARESVNVNTGERVTIDSHQKLTFTPDAAMKELVNKPFSQFETVVLNEGVDFAEDTTSEAYVTPEVKAASMPLVDFVDEDPSFENPIPLGENTVAEAPTPDAEPMPVVLPINILEIFIKPLSLCMRLFGNVLGSFVIMELLKMVVPPVLPAIFSCYFDIFDGLIQAYVFVFLTGLFIKEATE